MKLIWVLEDDAGSRFVYSELLKERFDVRFFERLKDFRVALASADPRPALIIADLQLADGNFMEFLAESARTDLLYVPFVVVSSLDDAQTLRTCFDEGALDYLTKPFSANELLVKVERVLAIQGEATRAASVPATTSTLSPLGASNAASGQLHFEPETLRVWKGKDLYIQLTAREVQIFSLLFRNWGRQLKRSELVQAVWTGVTVSPKTLDVHLFNLRRKLDPLGISIEFQAPDLFVLQRS